MKRDLQGNEASKFVNVGLRESAVMTNDVTMASNILQVTAESVSFSAGAAGTTGIVSLDKAPVFDAYGTRIGSKSGTSFAWVTGTVLTAEVEYNDALTDAEMLASFNVNGQYAIDYVMGRIYYKKATTGTSDTCNYKTRQLNVELTGASDIEIGAVELKDSTADTRADIKAANTARTTGTIVVAVQNVDAAGKVLNVGSGLMAASAPVTIATDDTMITALDLAVDTIVTATAIPTTLTGGTLAVTTAGTAEALGASLATKSIYIRAKSTNTSFVCVGDSAVDEATNQQIVLYANDSITLDIANRATVYVDADVNLEGVDYLAMS